MVQVATKIEMNPIAAGWGDAQRVFDVLDAALAKGPWILGETFSAADIMIGSGLNFAVRLFKMVPSRPSFDRLHRPLRGAAGVPACQRHRGGVRLRCLGGYSVSCFKSSGRGIEMML